MLRVNQNLPWRDFGNLLNSSLGMGSDLRRTFLNSLPQSQPSWPQFNLWSKEDDLILTAELPGLEAEQIDVDINNNQLTVAAKVDASTLNEDESYQRRERFSGSFQRTIKLPFAVDQEKSEARYVDGILEIHLTKPERDKPKKLAVSAG